MGKCELRLFLNFDMCQRGAAWQRRLHLLTS